MTDDREDLDPASLGQIMSLVLDAADPRRASDERDAATMAAAEISERGAYTAAIGYLRAMFDGILKHPQMGRAAVDSLLEQLAGVSIGALGVFTEGTDE